MPVATGLARPALPATFIYTPQRVPAGYGLAVLGRDPQQYDRPSIEAHDAAGGITGIYINPTLLNAGGKYAAILHSGSRAAPGGTNNGWGQPAFVDAALLDRLERVLNLIADDFSYLTRPMFFADDCGPDNARLYGSMTAAQRTLAYEWQIEIARVFRKVCDARGWICATNAEWDRRRGHGFPDAGQHGCKLYDLHTNERHPSVTITTDYWHHYMRDAQTNLKDAEGNNFGIHILSSVSDAQRVATLPFSGFVTAQTNYANPGPVIGTKRDLGIPFDGEIGPPPPPPDLPDEVAALKAEIANLTGDNIALRADADHFRMDRDDAFDRAMVALGERDQALARLTLLKARVAEQLLNHRDATSAILDAG